jgi:hypothetical protein
MDLADDERIKHLAELIQKETDRDKVLELTLELCRILDGGGGFKQPETKRQNAKRRSQPTNPITG